jgi:hypothetical protein
MNTIHFLSFCSFKIHFKITFPYFLGLPSGLFPSGFPTKTLYIFFISPHSCFMSQTFHPPWFEPPNIWWVESTNLLVMKFSPSSYETTLQHIKWLPLLSPALFLRYNIDVYDSSVCNDIISTDIVLKQLTTNFVQDIRFTKCFIRYAFSFLNANLKINVSFCNLRTATTI